MNSKSVSFSCFPGQVWAKTNLGDANSSCLNSGAQSWLPGLACGALFELSPLSFHPVIKGTTWNFRLMPLPLPSPCAPLERLRKVPVSQRAQSCGLLIYVHLAMRGCSGLRSLNNWKREMEEGEAGVGTGDQIHNQMTPCPPLISCVSSGRSISNQDSALSSVQWAEAYTFMGWL